MDNPTDPSATEAILRSVKIEVTVALGKAKVPIKELSRMSVDSVFTLDCSIDDPVALYVGSKLVAEGVLEQAEGDEPGAVAVRINQLFDQT